MNELEAIPEDFNVSNLNKFSLFKDVDLEFIEHLLLQCRIQRLSKGESLVVGTSSPATFYVVLEGELGDSYGRQLDVGRNIGEENLVREHLKSYEIKANLETQLLLITEEDFWRMGSLDQQLVRNLMHGKVKDQDLNIAKSNRPWLIAAIAVVLFLVGGAAYYYFGGLGQSMSSSSVPQVQADGQFRTVEVTTQPVVEWLNLAGHVQPTHWTEITSPISSLVTHMNFRVGDLVNREQLLLKLNTEEQEAKLRDAQTAMIKAQIEVEKYKNWTTGIELTRAKRQVSLAAKRLLASRQELESTKELFAEGIISSRELQSAKERFASDQANLSSAKESLQSTQLQGDRHFLQLAELNLENAKFRMSQIERAIKAAHIHSPTTGVVFAARKASKDNTDKMVTLGSAVTANQRLFAIADMVGIAVEAKVSEKDVLKLRKGMPVKVGVSAVSGLELDGVIDQIGERGVDSTRGMNNKAMFSVRIVVSDLSDQVRTKLRIGMNADAKVKIYDNPKAVVVPFSAVSVRNGQYWVKKVNNNGAISDKQVQVHTTLINGVEVSSGVQSGEKLVVQ